MAKRNQSYSRRQKRGHVTQKDDQVTEFFTRITNSLREFGKLIIRMHRTDKLT